MTRVLILLLFFSLGACAVNTQRTSEGAVETLKEQREFDSAEAQLANARYQDSYKLFTEFQTRHPQSVLLQSARLGEAKSLEGLSKWSEAIQIYNDIYKKTLRYQGDIAARAMYNMSFAYEALGDDMRTVTTLLDAQKLSRFLPPEVAYAEIPARLSMVYGKFERQPEAQAYFMEAEKGLRKVLDSKRDTPDKSWLAKTYFQMGSVSTNQLSAENFPQVALGQKQVQVYLMKSIELNDPVWSARSLSHLKNTYRDLFDATKSVELTDPSRREQQNIMGGTLIDLLNQAELYKPFNESKMNSLQVDLYSYLKEIRNQTEKLLYSNQETMALTKESEKLNSIKRILPKREKSPIPLPPKIVPSEDPNL
ncbi:hypothetical protein D3C87_88660 [compost metagenome]